MQPTIQILAERLIKARGLDFQITRIALKSHIKGLSAVDFLAEMIRIDNPDIFGKLWSVGLSSYQQQIATKRWEELTK